MGVLRTHYAALGVDTPEDVPMVEHALRLRTAAGEG
ncbi:MAG: hypothetical protein ABR497_02320 [Kiritimatiellia bacterium]